MSQKKINIQITENDEMVIWNALKKGNVDALGKLYDLYIDDLFAYGIKISTDKVLVMDCIHDLFLNLHKYHGKLTTPNNISAYLLTSLKRIIHAKGNSRIVHLTDSISLYNQSDESSKSGSYEDEIINYEHSIEKEKKLAHALGSLTQSQQRVLHLRFSQDKSYEEIAETMSVSIASARTIIYRALKILRKSALFLLFFIQ